MTLGFVTPRKAILCLICLLSHIGSVAAQTPTAWQASPASASAGTIQFVHREVLLVTLQVPIEPPLATEPLLPTARNESNLAMVSVADRPLQLEPIFVSCAPVAIDVTPVAVAPAVEEKPASNASPFRLPRASDQAVETVGCTTSSRSVLTDGPCEVCDPHVLLGPFTPALAVSVDSLLFHRSGGDTRTAVLQSNVRAESDRTPDEFRDWGFGPRLQVSRESNSGGWDFGGSIWILDGWNRKLQFIGDHSAAGVDVGVGNSRATYESDLASIDFNLKKYLTNWTRFVVGFRWMELDEQAIVRGSGTNVALLSRQVTLDNRLLGGQIGIDHTLWDRGGRFTMDINSRLGILANQIAREDVGFGSTRLTADSTSLLGDVEFAGMYQISRRWTATFGYHVMAISDVAFAIDQFSSPAELHNSGELVVHGFRAGLGLTW